MKHVVLLLVGILIGALTLAILPVDVPSKPTFQAIQHQQQPCNCGERIADALRPENGDQMPTITTIYPNCPCCPQPSSSSSSPSSSSSSSGGESSPCCPGVLIPDILHFDITGDYTASGRLSYMPISGGTYYWFAAGITLTPTGAWAGGTTNIYMTCTLDGFTGLHRWDFTSGNPSGGQPPCLYDEGFANLSGASCSPFLQTYQPSRMTCDGGSTFHTITITVSQ